MALNWLEVGDDGPKIAHGILQDYPMKILHVITSMNPADGGPTNWILTCSRVLQEQGHVSDALTVDDPAAPFIATSGMKIHATGPATKLFGYSSKLKHWVRENAKNYDFIVFHNIWDYCTAGTYYAARKQGVKLVTFPHGMLDPYFNIAFPRKKIKKMVYWNWGVGPVIRDSVLTLFTTEEEKILARQSFSPYQPKELVISYGVLDPAPDEVKARAAFATVLPQLEGKKYLIYLSRIHPKKGCDLLVEAFGKVYGQSDMELVIAGPDPVGLVKGLKEQAEKLGVGDRVHFPGMLKGDFKWGAYLGSEAFILPSHQENFGQVVAEAMALGKPVMISDKVNIHREVSSTGSGFVEPDTLEGTVRLLETWKATSDEKRAEMGIAARKAFEKHFEGSKSIEDFVACLQPHL